MVPSNRPGHLGATRSPTPQSGTWGDHPCGMREAVTEAVTELCYGGFLCSKVRKTTRAVVTVQALTFVLEVSACSRS